MLRSKVRALVVKSAFLNNLEQTQKKFHHIRTDKPISIKKLLNDNDSVDREESILSNFKNKLSSDRDPGF